MTKGEAGPVANPGSGQGRDLHDQLDQAAGHHPDGQAANAVGPGQAQGTRDHHQIEKHPGVLGHGVMIQAVQRALDHGQQAVHDQHRQHQAEQEDRQVVILPAQAGSGDGQDGRGGHITHPGQRQGDAEGGVQGQAEDLVQLGRTVSVAGNDRHEEIAQHSAEKQGLDHFRHVIGDQKRVGQPRGAKQGSLDSLTDKAQRPAQQGGDNDRPALADQTGAGGRVDR